MEKNKDRKQHTTQLALEPPCRYHFYSIKYLLPVRSSRKIKADPDPTLKTHRTRIRSKTKSYLLNLYEIFSKMIQQYFIYEYSYFIIALLIRSRNKNQTIRVFRRNLDPTLWEKNWIRIQIATPALQHFFRAVIKARVAHFTRLHKRILMRKYRD